MVHSLPAGGCWWHYCSALLGAGAYGQKLQRGDLDLSCTWSDWRRLAFLAHAAPCIGFFGVLRYGCGISGKVYCTAFCRLASMYRLSAVVCQGILLFMKCFLARSAAFRLFCFRHCSHACDPSQPSLIGVPCFVLIMHVLGQGRATGIARSDYAPCACCQKRSVCRLVWCCNENVAAHISLELSCVMPKPGRTQFAGSPEASVAHAFCLGSQHSTHMLTSQRLPLFPSFWSQRALGCCICTGLSLQLTNNHNL